MAKKHDLKEWIVDALKEAGGSLSYVLIAKRLWEKHELELRASGSLFYTWQYDMRWAANQLRRDKILKPVEESTKGIWELM